jgi:hypothetical protein
MSDKSKNSHIERTCYVAPSVKPGDSIRYGDWHDRETIAIWYDEAYEGPGNPLGRYESKGTPLTLIESATGSDYSGTLVEKSNALALKEKFPWLVELHGGHGTFGVAYLGRREHQNPELIEAIDALTDYPLFDEDHHSHLEMDAVNEAWSESYGGRHDWKQALVEFFDEIDEDHDHERDVMDDSLVDQLWCDCTERFRGGEDHLNEQGDQIYFPIGDVIEAIEKRWGEDGIARWKGLDERTYSDDNRTIREKLQTLCEACRVTDDTQPTQGA